MVKLGEVERNGTLVTFHDSRDRPGFLQESSGLLWVGRLDLSGSSISLSAEQTSALVKHLQAWLDVGSFELSKNLCSSHNNE